MPDYKPLPPLDPEMDANSNHYWSYHSLDTLLGCKRPLTAARDEDLFISVHQMCELAFHQMIIDLDRTIEAFEGALETHPIGSTRDTVYFLNRVVRLYGSINVTMPILTTMRAFAEFRTSIGPTSGFQSAQFRRLEIMSGVRQTYWEGATADAAGVKHVAETQFDVMFGDDVRKWFETYRDRSIKSLTEELLKRATLAELKAHPQARPLLRLLRAYDKAQLRFHKLHLGLAISQLKRVGVTVGTGGTSPATYLARYAKEHAPLFPALAT